MAVRFNIPAFAVERLSFAYSPLVEAVLSLHVLMEPKHHPLQHEFVLRLALCGATSRQTPEASLSAGVRRLRSPF